MCAFGLVTHFGALISDPTMTAVAGFAFTHVRLDMQTADVPLILDAVAEARRPGGITPLVIVAYHDQIALLPDGLDLDLEWTNEPDGDVSPTYFQPGFARAARLAKERGCRLWGPAISNLDFDSLRWLKRLRDAGKGWPPELYGISVHRYGDGTFETPHHGFTSRHGEVAALRQIIGALPFGVSEFGYPSITGSEITEIDQADLAVEEFEFWRQEGAAFADYYQINDGPTNERLDRYGIRHCQPDGTLTDWKPAAQAAVRAGAA